MEDYSVALLFEGEVVPPLLLLVQGSPAATISALEAAYRGSTSPGQSHRVRRSVTLSVWKCLVLPGVGATAVFLDPKRALIVEDLPTLG